MAVHSILVKTIQSGQNWWADLQMDIAITKAMDSRASEGRKNSVCILYVQC